MFMKEFIEEYDGEFFIIDSNNLEYIENKFYGYMVHKNKIITNDNITDNIIPTGLGAYLWVKVDENSIKIIQDFNGSYGIYLYRQGEYFAISNSYIKLAEYLKDSYELTFNQDYANSFIFADLCSFGYNNTLINEINLISRYYEIEINKSNSKISFNKLDFNEKSILLDSEEGFEILDNWFNQWVTIIRSIKYETDNVQFDLTGGFDSRIVSILWLSANINLNRIFVKTIENDVRKDLIEDYEIASEIGNKFNFKLNANNKFQTGITGFNEMTTPILKAFYTKLGFHKEINFPTNKYDEIVYTVNGRGGETIRNYYNQTPNEYIQKNISRVADKGENIIKSTENILNDSFERLSKDFPNLSWDSIDLPEQLYKEVRCRNHFGKIFVDEYNRNIINLAPLLDPQLQKLKLTTSECKDRDLLLALIFIRYMPELLKFRVQGNRKISEETVEYAKKINNKYPLSKKNYTYINKPRNDAQKRKFKKGEIIKGGCTNYIKNIFNSYQFEYEFKKYFPPKLYNQIFNEINNNPPRLNNLYSSMAILNAINYTEEDPQSIVDWLYNFLKSPEDIGDNEILERIDLSLFKTARIDLINEGEFGCNFEIISIDDSYCQIKSPSWLQKDNKSGRILISEMGELNLKVRCIKNGKFRIFLRALDTKDKHKLHLPIFVDFQEFIINNKNFFNDNKLLCYNDHFNVNFDVKDSEILDIHIRWKPLIKSGEWVSAKF